MTSILPQIELTRERVRLELLARTAQEGRQRRVRVRLSAIGVAVIVGLAVNVGLVYLLFRWL